jgi:hypothetical protein
MIFIDAEKIIAVFFEKLDLEIVVGSKVKTHQLIHVPAKLVIFYRGNNSNQSGIFKKVIGKIVEIEFEFHARV